MEPTVLWDVVKLLNQIVMKNSNQTFQKISEETNGKLVGGFSGVLNKFRGNSLMEQKNEGQCIVINNCVAGSNCANSCTIFPPKS